MAYDLTGLNVIMGTAADETLNGTNRDEAIYGMGGVDFLSGGRGKDILFGGDSGVTFGYSADGTWSGVSSTNAGDPLGAGSGTSFSLSGYSQSRDVFVGTGTNNTLEMGNGRRALFLDDGVSPSVDSVRLVNIQTIVGGTGGQIIDLTSSTVGYGDVTILAGSGADVLMGNAGNDTIRGGNGNDYIWGGSGNDVLEGGANNDQIFGATGDDVLDGGTGNDAMTGGTGNDTYVVDSTGDTVVEAAGGGTDSVISSINYTLGANVENLTLTGGAIDGTGNALDNVIIGNANNNVLNGGDGNDWLDGGVGNDTMTGGAGDDTFIVEGAGDTVIEAAGGGTDTVASSISYALGANVENLTLTGTAAINGTGNDLNNTITGNANNNQLDGGAGADTLQGGTGDDTYIVDNAGDVIVELSGEGTDHVLASTSHTLGDNVENLTLIGAASINGTGNALDNAIAGNTGDNVLDGGAGADTLQGGAGNDTYIIDDPADLVGEDASAGIDLVRSTISYVLTQNVEQLTLEGAADINATGSDLANVLTGNAGNNSLNGGAGADDMIGGAGNDTYFVDNAGDAVVENAGEGIDHVQSSITFTLAADVENLTLTGTAAINGTGNTLDNTVTGNSGANELDGGNGNDFIVGGGGNDTIQGGDGIDNLWGHDGNDTIYGGAGKDNINGGAGTDSLYGGDGNDGLFGGGMNDVLRGENGNDKLYGDGGNDTIIGGAGDDWMVGGQLTNGFSAGNDTFAWSRSDIVDGSGVRAGFDTIVDFGAGDRLDFSGVFAGQPAAPIADLVRVTDYFNGTLVSVNLEGTTGWVDAVILRDVHGIDLDDLTGANAVIV